VAVSLVGEVVAYITGSDLTTAERLVLLTIAEQANAGTRQAYQVTGEGGKRRWMLGEVVGLSPTGLRDVFQRLAKRGIEVRVAFGKDSKGRTLYAVYGRQTTYCLPELPRRLGDGPASPRGDSQPSGRGDGQAPTGDGQAPTGDAGPSPFPSASRQAPKSSSEPRQIVMNNTDAKPSEADAVVARVRNERNPRNLGGLLIRMARDGDLQEWVNQVRAARIKADAHEADAADRKVSRNQPTCDHGKAGGAYPHSVSGQIRCKACRDIQQFNERTAS
jgi:hypothetical protein